MATALTPEFEPERLRRQEIFLRDRAMAHDKIEDDKVIWHHGCATTLMRDAASLALLRGDALAATRLFSDAGRRFSDLGLFTGFSLLELGRRGQAREWRRGHEGLDERISAAMPSDEHMLREESPREPFLVGSAALPGQLLHLYYVLSADQELNAGERGMHERIHAMLKQLPELPVGPTGIPVGRYVDLIDEISDMDSNAPRISDRARDIFLSAILRRHEQLDAARNDTRHWNMLLNPTDLIDLNLTALSTMVVDRIGSAFLLEEVVGEREPMVMAPIRAAEMLRSHDRPTPPVRTRY